MSNTMRNNPVEEELDAIRLELYEKTKTMTASEITEYITKQVTPIVRKYNIPTSPTTKSTPPFRYNSD